MRSSLCFLPGVQVGTKEYTFAQGAGVVSVEFDPSRDLRSTPMFQSARSPDPHPEEMEDAVFAYALDMGDCYMTGQEIATAVDTLRREFAGENYHILEKNCNHFSDALCKRLVGKGVPSYINRAAWLGRWIR